MKTFDEIYEELQTSNNVLKTLSKVKGVYKGRNL